MPAVGPALSPWGGRLLTAVECEDCGHVIRRGTLESTAGQLVHPEPVRLGAFLDSTRRRTATLSPERRAQLHELGMRW
ncbi:helicase associated domain-containing protein [Streptomyces sp. NBC_00414]|uniref:helicase associated domain-containing protein n=1 Tax=Streptomyces sp. NBC_00414 TaxID=2975739 RepID=UPI002E1A83A0